MFANLEYQGLYVKVWSTSTSDSGNIAAALKWLFVSCECNNCSGVDTGKWRLGIDKVWRHGWAHCWNRDFHVSMSECPMQWHPALKTREEGKGRVRFIQQSFAERSLKPTRNAELSQRFQHTGALYSQKMQHARAHKVALKHILQMQVGPNKVERPHAHTKRERGKRNSTFILSKGLGLHGFPSNHAPP